MAVSRATWEYAERWVVEDDVLTAARRRADEVGCVPIGPGGGASLRFLAAVVGARAVVEVGTGTGVSGTWLLRGMRPDGVLTSIDVEPEHQRLARMAYEEAGFPPSRVRLICGAALDVLPRMTDGAYDLVFVDSLRTEYQDYLDAGLRLLRPGGVFVFDNALWQGMVADPSVSDAQTIGVRETVEQVVQHPALVPVLLPVSHGLLAAVKTT